MKKSEKLSPFFYFFVSQSPQGLATLRSQILQNKMGTIKKMLKIPIDSHKIP